MKRFLLWRDDWRLGIEGIDNQHLRLVELVNQIADALHAYESGTAEQSTAMRLVLQLQIETRLHFRSEEAFMRECDYPEYVSHHREHAMLQAELKELLREIEEGKRKFDIDTLTSLKHWLINHVIDSDLEIARYLHKEKPAPAEDQLSLNERKISLK
ncbi:MAG: bacteriohemerythrin [Candidatus Thiodiazotropha sp.]